MAQSGTATGRLSAINAAALVCAELLSVLIFPAAALGLLRGTRVRLAESPSLAPTGSPHHAFTVGRRTVRPAPRTAFGQRSDSAPRHGGTTPATPGDAMITVHVPAMTARHDVRAISAAISDVPGVQTLRADLATGTVQVTGSADPAAITAAVTAAGYTAVDYTVPPATDGSPPTGTSRTGPSGAQTRRHHRSEDVRSTPTLDHSPDTHHRRSRRSS